MRMAWFYRGSLAAALGRSSRPPKHPPQRDVPRTGLPPVRYSTIAQMYDAFQVCGIVRSVNANWLRVRNILDTWK